MVRRTSVVDSIVRDLSIRYRPHRDRFGAEADVGSIVSGIVEWFRHRQAVPQDVREAISQNARLAYRMYAPAQVQAIVSTALDYARRQGVGVAGDVQGLAARALGYAATALGLPTPTQTLQLPAPPPRPLPGPAATAGGRAADATRRKRARQAQRQARRVTRQRNRFELSEHP